jgi:xylulokinase
MSVVLGIDLGTQSTKVLVYDAEAAKVLALVSAPHALISEADGTREQEAGWWLEALKTCMAALDPALKQRVKAIGVSGQQHGFVPVDAAGEVLHRVKLWCDTSTVAECREIEARFGGAQRMAAELGNAVAPGFTASKILWLKKKQPQAYAKLRHILLPHDYLNFWLTGQVSAEAGDASGTALFNVPQRRWDAGAVKALDPDRDLMSCLPPLTAAGKACGSLRAEIAQALGLPAGIPVSAGGGDNMMAAIGTGTLEAGVVTVSLGSSGTVFTRTPAPLLDPQGRFAAFCSSDGGWLPLLCTMNCTLATELMRELFGLSLEQMETAVAAVAAGSGGAMLLPYFNGERVPDLPQAKGSILGLDPANTRPGHLLRATMESVAYGLNLGLAALTELKMPAKKVRLVGGGAKSAVWRQICADVFGLSVEVVAVEEAAAFGAALQALWTLEGGASETLATLQAKHVRLDASHAVRPGPAVAVYQDGFGTYLKHVKNISGPSGA